VFGDHLIKAMNLTFPQLRRELLSYLGDLSVADPRQVWTKDRDQGLISDIDQVFHFFFDDHDFDETEIGRSLWDEREVKLIHAVKGALEAILQDFPDGDDNDFDEHPLWPEVRQSAIAAAVELSTR
jgi:hypothetical protein